jgi:mersacidin/lichenicidin family type 2 lantibiotic
MTAKDIIRAWKDPTFRSSLSDAERAALPDHPAGIIELDGTVLDSIAGGKKAKTTTRATGSGKLKKLSGSGSSKSGKSHKSHKSSK